MTDVQRSNSKKKKLGRIVNYFICLKKNFSSENGPHFHVIHCNKNLLVFILNDVQNDHSDMKSLILALKCDWIVYL